MALTKVYCPEISSLIDVLPLVTLYRISQERTAKIKVTPYKSRIRYKYPNEDWQEVEASDFEIENTPAYTETFLPHYFIEFEATVNGRYPPQETLPVQYAHGQTIKGTTFSSYAKIDFDSITPNDYSSTLYYLEIDYVQTGQFGNTGRYENTDCFKRSISQANIRGNEPDYPKSKSFRTLPSTSSTIGITNLRNFTLVEDNSRSPMVCKTIIPECIFKVYKCEQLIHEEIREVCPEVINPSCLLDEDLTEEIEIKLEPFDVLFITKGITNALGIFSIFNILNSALNFLPFDNFILDYLRGLLEGNPKECSIIFTYPASSAFNGFQVTDLLNINIIKQICSDCGCFPPKIEVTCEGESCPINTCAVDCGDKICCYNSQGVSIKTIEK